MPAARVDTIWWRPTTLAKRYHSPAADDRADLWEIMAIRWQTRQPLAATATAES
jgi:hypothetical protein